MRGASPGARCACATCLTSPSAYRAGALSTSQVDVICAYLTDRRRPTLHSRSMPISSPGSRTSTPPASSRSCASGRPRSTTRTPHRCRASPSRRCTTPEPSARRSGPATGRSAQMTPRSSMLPLLHSKAAALIEGELAASSERRADALVDLAKFGLDRHDKPQRRRHAPACDCSADPRPGHRAHPGPDAPRPPPQRARHRHLALRLRRQPHAPRRRRAPRDGPRRPHGTSAPLRRRRRGALWLPLPRLRPARAHWCDAHHAKPWEHGGSTDACELRPPVQKASHQDPPDPTGNRQAPPRRHLRRSRCRPAAALQSHDHRDPGRSL